MSHSFDVIIVGAGPAGISTAIYCANSDLNVLVIDSKEKKKIGDKVCGEAISKKTVLAVSESLKISPPRDSEINAEVETLVLQTSNPSISLSMPAIGFMIDRHIYGQRLLEEALKRGITLFDRTRALRPLIENNKVIGLQIKKRGEAPYDVFGKMIVDCSGVMAVVRTNLPDDFAPLLKKSLLKSEYASCFREIIKLQSDHNLDGKIVLQYEDAIPEPGYLWFFADGKRKLNCGTGFVKVGKHANKSVKNVYYSAMHKYYPKESYTILDARGDSVSVQSPLWNAVAPGLIVAGDAAYHADPLTAEGHGPALMAGVSAGEVIQEAIKTNNYDTSFLWDYNVKIMSRFGHDNTEYKIMTKVLAKIGPKKLEYLLKNRVIEESDLKSVAHGTGESLSSLLKRAIRCFPRIGLLMYLKKAMGVRRQIKQLCKQFPSSPEHYLAWKQQVFQLYSAL